jgi:penicillin-binding protein 2
MDPFADKNYLNRKFHTDKNLSLEEILVDSKDEAELVEDDRESLSMRLLLAVMIVPLVFLGARLYFLQTVKAKEYKALAAGNKLRATATIAPRGLIMDAYGKTIASNVPNFELDAVPADLPKDPASIKSETDILAQILGMDAVSLENQVNAFDKKSYQTYDLVPSVPKDQALIVMARANEFAGFNMATNPVRDYKDAEMFAPLIGYTGKITQSELDNHQGQSYLQNDYIGKTGIELQYENYLRGISGQKQSEIDAQGNVKKSLAEIPAVPGQNIKLNIDYDLQKVIYDSLKSVLDKNRLTKGAAVATNPKTGQVLALVSFPTYDSNLFAKGISQTDYSKLIANNDHPLLNRVVAGQYPPGSTVKPMLAIAGLSEGVITPTTKILDDGVIRVGSFTFYGYNHSGLGVMDVFSAIAKSSDIFFYTVGGGRAGTSIAGLGPDREAQWYRKFHLGSPLGIDLPGEKGGLVPDPAWKQQSRGEQWFLGDTYHTSIGQGDLLVTPLQVNSWTSTVANGGLVMQPYILDQVLDKDGKVIKQMQPTVLAKDQFNPDYVKDVQTGMRMTTLPGGSASSLQTVHMSISGKTGSAQFDPKDPSRTHAWFTSYAPSEDPQIALTVLVEGAGEGTTYSVPVTHMVYDWYVANRLKK